MFKNLVNRSTFKRFTISDTSPVTLPIEGDEVYLNLVPGGDVVQVNFATIRETALRTAVPEDTLLSAKPVLQVNQQLCLNDVITQSGATYNDYSASARRLLVGFSDNVTFSMPDGVVGTADILVEIINYEVRR